MTIQNLDREELEKKLEDVINQLEKKGLIPTLSPDAKKALTKKVSEELIKDPKISLSKDDLKNENVEKSLGLACMAELVPNNTFDYKILFRKQLEIEPKELQDQLKLLFTNVLKLHPHYQNKTKMQQMEMEAEMNKLAKKVTESCLENSKEPLLNNDKVMGFVNAGIDLLSEQRRTLYGVDTHNPGGVLKPVLEVHETAPVQKLEASGESFMAKKEAAAPVLDPLGIHMANLINMLTDGNTSGYEQYLMDKDVIPSAKHEAPSPFHTKPSPFDEN